MGLDFVFQFGDESLDGAAMDVDSAPHLQSAWPLCSYLPHLAQMHGHRFKTSARKRECDIHASQCRGTEAHALEATRVPSHCCQEALARYA